ncbi:hypothetical protein M0Q50_09450 [bacterium]|jgi:hypothetical protein|nr:hypothetical protein [bacterium]
MRKYLLFGKKAEYETFTWWENFMGGHISIGSITIFGANAMNWSVNIRNRKYGFICFTLPSIRRRKYGMKPYFYVSPDGTPQSSTFYRGGENERNRANLRRKYLGHRYNYNDPIVYEIWNYIRNWNDIPPEIKANELRLKKLKCLFN